MGPDARGSIGTQALIRRMARDNPRWGAVRIVGALRLVGIEVSASTVRVYRRQALRRPPAPQWRTFLRLHAAEIWASDFFTVQTWTFRTLYVFIVISHERRRIEHWNVTTHPRASWVWWQVIAATAWSRTPRFWIRDRDTSYGGDFVVETAGIGIRTVLTPVRAVGAQNSIRGMNRADPRASKVGRIGHAAMGVRRLNVPSARLPSADRVPLRLPYLAYFPGRPVWFAIGQRWTAATI